MSKVRDYSDQTLKDREDSKRRKEEELEARRNELKEASERREKNAALAEEVMQKNAKKKSSSNLSYYIVFALLGGLTLYVVVMLFLNQTPSLTKTPTIDDKKIEDHNSNFQWKQGANTFFEGSTLADAKKIITASFSSHSNLPRCQLDDTITPPENFNSKDMWPKCVNTIANQTKTCGSSYAFALSQTFSERMCIQSNDNKLTPLSAQELIACDQMNSGCKSGYLNNSLDYMKSKGLVDEQCLPYKPENEKCEGMCKNPTRYKLDSYCITIGEDDIKREIMKNGPVVSVTQIHVDMLTYKSGVYSKGDDVPKFGGFHAVKIVGWGVESGSENEPNKGNKYWIVQNSWGEDWGENGYAKISFGQEFMFEQYGYSLKIKQEKANDASNNAQKDEVPKAKEDVADNVDLDDLKLDDEEAKK